MGLFILLFSLSYFFVPIYEFLCSQFGWGALNSDSYFINKKFLSKPFISKFNIEENNLELMKNLLKSNFRYRTNIHFDSTFQFILIPIVFNTEIHGKLPLLFFVNEDLIQVRPQSSQLVIFNIYNFSKNNIDFFIGYQIFPYQLTKYIIKLQCFCYEHILILGYSFLKLPVLFYVDDNIFKYGSSFLESDYSCIFFYYHIYKSSKSLNQFLN